MGCRALASCVTSPHPETDRLEAKQLRMCLLSKRELGYQDNSQSDRRCLVEVPNAPRQRAERAHAEADYGDFFLAFVLVPQPTFGQQAQAKLLGGDRFLGGDL